MFRIDSSPDPTQGHDLQIHVSPTRDRQRQFAQFQILNIGHRPILLDGWFVIWTDQSMSVSMSYFRGTFPIRLQDHERAIFLADISNHPVEQLEGLGVLDAERRYWHADTKELRRFVNIAKQHQLPKIDSSEAVNPNEVSILVATANSKVDGSKRLEIRFKNLGSHDLNLRSAHVEWCFNPPRETPKEPGEPQVAEVGGSISLKLEGTHPILKPNSEAVFFLGIHDPLAQLIVEVLADDVPEDQLSVKISASRWKWIASGDEVPGAIREFAQAVLHDMR